MFGTPDFGQSDLWHFNFSLKFLLAQALKLGYLPFWSKDIGMGFPLLAEGQIGIFYLPNLILYRFFDAVLAFNLSYFFVFLTTFLGSFLFGRAIRLNRLSSFFLAFVFTFSGVMVTQVPHLNLIQVVSWIPWQFLLVEKLVKHPRKIWLLGVALVFSFQIFAAYQQIVLISLIGSISYLFFRTWQEKKIKGAIYYLIGLIFGFIVALPQFLPAWEFVKLSFRSNGTPVSELVRFPYMPINLLSFINPYFFGDPRIGGYPPFSQNWGIFWESTGYIGILPLFLVGLAIFQKKFRKIRAFWFYLLALSLILMLGKSTPFFFVFQLPIINLFRVPARFLVLFVWVLTTMSAISLNNFKSPVLKWLIVIISVLNLGYFSWQYNATINPTKWLVPSQTVKILAQDTSWYRIYCPTPVTQWNNILLSAGWKNMDAYLPFKNCINGNQNLLWNIPVIDVRSGLESRRMDLWQGYVNEGLVTNITNNTLEISSSSAKLLAISGVKYFITPYATRYIPLATTSGQTSFTIYKLENYRPHAYLTNNFQVAQTQKDLFDRLKDASNSSVVLEEQPPLTAGSYHNDVKIIKNQDLEVKIEAAATEPALLVLSDTYYPNWSAYLDGIKTKIYATNLIERGVVVPAGVHIIDFRYNWSQIL